MYIDDLYLVLVTHWVWDDAVFPDERQRVQVSTALLLAAFTGCRPCSLFDTRLKFDDTDDIKITDNNAKNDIDGDGNGDCDSYTDSDTIIGSGSGSDSNDSDMDGDFVINGDSDMDSDDNMDSGIDGKSNIDVDYDSDSGTDDDCEAGTDKTKSILYRHISIIVVRNPIPEKANIVLAKITLLHTKGEDNRPQV